MNDREIRERVSAAGRWLWESLHPNPLKEAIRKIPESNEPETCRHGRLGKCWMCKRFEKQ